MSANNYKMQGSTKISSLNLRKTKYSALEEDLLTPLDENLWDKDKKEEPDLDDILETPIIPGTSGIDC